MNYYDQIKMNCNSVNDLWKLTRTTKSNTLINFSTYVKQDGEETDSINEISEDILNKFIRKSNNNYDINQKSSSITTIESLKIEELELATKQLNSKSAPGLDGITVPIIKYLVKKFTGYFLELLNKLVSNCIFPKSWKYGKLVIFTKPNKKTINCK